MRLSKEERERREAERQEREFNRIAKKFQGLARGASVSFDKTGRVCLTYSNGQIFKCCGPVPEFVFGHAPKVVK